LLETRRQNQQVRSGRGISNFKESRQEDREKSFKRLFNGKDNVDCGCKNDGIDRELYIKLQLFFPVFYVPVYRRK
jgi:hypothetical protein